MDDDELAHAWESFATALREVPEQRIKRRLRQPSQFSDFGISPEMQDSMLYQARAMQAGLEHHRYRGIQRGIFGFGIMI